MAVTLEQARQLLLPEEPNYASAARLGPELLPHLKALAGGRNAMLASKATYLASLIDHDQTQDVLRSAAASPSAIVRVAAASAAKNLKRPAASAVILALLNDSDQGVRKHAIKSAGTRSNAALSAKVAELQRKDPSPALRALAARTVSRGSGTVAEAEFELAAPAGGSRPRNVKWIQQFLNQKMGLNLPASGVLGLETRSALRSFLNRYGHPRHKIERQQGETGSSGDSCLDACWQNFENCLAHTRFPPECMARLNTCQTACAPPPAPPVPTPAPPSPPPAPVIPPTVKRGSKGPVVATLQSKINGWVVVSGSKVPLLVTDGDFGPKTEGAVKAYQRAKGLAPDGVAGPITWGSLLTP